MSVSLSLGRAVALVLTVSFVQLPLQAQSASAASSGKGDEFSPVCLSRPFREVAQIRRQDRGKPFAIVAVGRSVGSFEAKGFKQVSCEAVRLGSPEQQTGYRDRVCKLAATGNEATQNQFARALGEHPSVLCANANIALSRSAPESSAEK